MGSAIEVMEKAEARRRQQEAIKDRDEQGRAKPTSENFSEVVEPESRRSATPTAEAVGMSRPTYMKAKEIVAAAEAEPETETQK
jgi:hypothetical protein